MIRLLCIALAIVSAVSLRADTYLFMFNRFGGIEIKTLDELAIVRFFQGNKKREETIFESKLLSTSVPFTYLTFDGVEFKIEKLTKSVIHDANRGINSGDYMLRITGTGEAYDEIIAKLPHMADFASSEDEMTFYGKRY